MYCSWRVGLFFFSVMLAGQLYAEDSRKSHLLRDEGLFNEKRSLSSDLGLFYQRDAYGVTDGVIVNDSLSANWTLRYGVFRDLEFSFVAPLLARQQSLIGNGLIFSSEKNVGLADISYRLRYRLSREGALRPDMVLALQYRPAFSNRLNEGSPLLSDEVHQWGISFFLAKSVSPAVLYGGLGYDVRHAGAHYGFDPGPVDYLSYRGGVAYSLSDQVSLNILLVGSYYFAQEIAQVNYSALHPISLQIVNTFMFGKDFFLEPMLSVGLTPESQDVLFGISMPLF